MIEARLIRVSVRETGNGGRKKGQPPKNRSVCLMDRYLGCRRRSGRLSPGGGRSAVVVYLKLRSQMGAWRASCPHFFMLRHIGSGKRKEKFHEEAFCPARSAAGRIGRRSAGRWDVCPFRFHSGNPGRGSPSVRSSAMEIHSIYLEKRFAPWNFSPI